MRRILILFAHPNQQVSDVNRELAKTAKDLDGITLVDLYAEYPRFKIEIDKEQKRLLEHDAIIFQFPVYWYSTPSLLKEWMDLTLEHGFAYGENGDKLANKLFMIAASAGGPQDAYTQDGYHHTSIRTLLKPLEHTAGFCHMQHIAPLILFSATDAKEQGRVTDHAEAYKQLLLAIRDETLDLDKAKSLELLDPKNLPIKMEA